MENQNVCKTETAGHSLNVKESPTILRRPLLLSSQKWNTMKHQLKKEEESFEQAEQERKYKEYLKEGSRELTKKWPNALNRGSDQTTVDHQKKLQQERLQEDERIYKENKEIDDKIRQENIAKAQHMILRQKSGPKELESASMLCEILKGREIQRAINAEFNKTLREHKQKEDLKFQAQATQWIEGDQKRSIEMRRRNEEYKKELIKNIKEEEKSRADHSKKQKEFERKVREQADKDLQAQIERERVILQRKKETMRKNALEAMKMVEQRRLRDKLENEIDNQIIAIFAKGKDSLNKMKKEKEQELQRERALHIEQFTKKTYMEKPDYDAIENQRIQKAVNETTAKLNQQEKEKHQKEKEIKAQRIKCYMEAVEKQKLLKAQQYEQFRLEMANRIKNEEINEEFERQRIQEKMKKAREIQAALLEQVKEKQQFAKLEKEMDERFLQLPCDDNKLFLQYADQLIQNAKNKSRPILPLLKVVEQYKKDNEIGLERKEPRHLKSNLPINDEPRPNCSGQPVIKYDLNELKEMNPGSSPRSQLWS